MLLIVAAGGGRQNILHLGQTDNLQIDHIQVDIQIVHPQVDNLQIDHPKMDIYRYIIYT